MYVQIKVKTSEASKTIEDYKKLGYECIGYDNYLEGTILSFRQKENNATNIKFHIGDFVEDKDGKVGYISDICHCEECEKRGFFEPTIQYLDGTSDYISNYSANNIFKDYKQIGIQRFDNDYLQKEIEILKRQLEEEKSKSAYWKLKANGEEPVVMGSKEGINYISE